MQKDTTSSPNSINTVLCDVCHCSERRLAITVNEVTICYGCVGYFNSQAKHLQKPVMQIIEHQTNYERSLVANIALRTGLCDVAAIANCQPVTADD